MALKVYRIDTSFIGKIFGIFRETDIPLQSAIGPKTFGNVSKAIDDYVKYDNHYVIKNEDELGRFKNPLGNGWIEKEQYYIRHPKEVKTRCLIEAEKFHEFIYREQIAEIVSFLRSNFMVKHLTISVEDGLDFNAFTRVPIEGMQFEGNVSIKKSNSKELVIDCPQGLRLSEKRTDYIWINDFQDLIAVADNFSGGEFKHVIKIDNAFGLGIEEAKTIGVGLSWLQKSKFEIRFRG